jgi:hypothetical protein
MRVWRDREDVMRKMEGVGPSIRKMVTGTWWRPWIMPPKFSYSFSNPDSGMSMFDPFRYMLRRAYAEDTDLKAFCEPQSSRG